MRESRLSLIKRKESEKPKSTNWGLEGYRSAAACWAGIAAYSAATLSASLLWFEPNWASMGLAATSTVLITYGTYGTVSNALKYVGDALQQKEEDSRQKLDLE